MEEIIPKAKVCMLTSHHAVLDDKIFYNESIGFGKTLAWGGQ